jgi:2-C-methyl-D-erythritol 4-phosphate cytidylyltransferase
MASLNTKPEGTIWAVMPAGGSGLRYSATEDKLLAAITGIPVLQHTITGLLAAPSISGITLVCSARNRETYQSLITRHFPNAPVHFVPGGATRRDSVYNGLNSLPPEVDIVVIHDAARPLIRSEWIEHAIAQVKQGASGAIVAIPVYDTLKQAQPGGNTQMPCIQTTLDRSLLWRAQTPQVFNRQILMQAHTQVPHDIPVTDDAQLVELANLGKVVLIPGDERNLKITTPADIQMAEALLQAERLPLL